MKDITIHYVEESEVVNLQKIGKQTFSESFGDKNSVSDMELYLQEKFSMEQLLSELKKAESQFFFIKEKQEIVGYLKVNRGEVEIEKNEDKTLEIERIYVLSTFQGKGLGKILLKKAIEIAKQKKAKTVWLGVWEENLSAIRFYKRNGFVEFGKHKFMLGNDEQTDILMKLRLD